MSRTTQNSRQHRSAVSPRGARWHQAALLVGPSDCCVVEPLGVDLSGSAVGVSGAGFLGLKNPVNVTAGRSSIVGTATATQT